MGKGFQKQKKQARLMQGKLAELQEKMQNVEGEGSAGNGLVTIVLNSDFEIKKLLIKPECVDPEDIEGLQALILLAHKNAMEKVKTQLPSMENLPPNLFEGGMPNLSSLGFGI